MSEARRSSPGRASLANDEASSVLGGALTTRNLESFSRKVTATAGHLLGPIGDPLLAPTHYQNAMAGIHKELRRPGMQRRIFSFAKASPSEIVRSKLSTVEIQNRALTHLSDEVLSHIPEANNPYSLFQGFQATLPEISNDYHGPLSERIQKLITDGGVPETSESILKVKRERDVMTRRLDMMGVRKNMASAEIKEIDNKIANLSKMRLIVLDRLTELEQDEALLERDILDLDHHLEELEDHLSAQLPDDDGKPDVDPDLAFTDSTAESASFMSESIYEKLPSPKTKKPRYTKRKSMPILHEHYDPGSSIREIDAHNDLITAIDFDVPFGTLVSAAFDDTVKVWDLGVGRCIGLLEGHQAYVRCLQVEDNLVATGSVDASIRIWDLSKADYSPQDQSKEEEDDGLAIDNPDQLPPPPPPGSMRDCHVLTLEAHIGEVTALSMRGNTLISGAADKTLRQWDLEKARCVQTLDVLWAAAQSSTATIDDTKWRHAHRASDSASDFVGALQCFDAALAVGTADGMVRLWDLRSGQVHRSLVGHTGPITALQFDEMHLVTSSLDRSIRIWDLRTGSIYDAFAYDSPITSMHFDSRRIVAAAGEDIVKVYDKTDGRQWDCGAGLTAEELGNTPGIVEKVRIKDGFLVEARRDGDIGIWTC